MSTLSRQRHWQIANPDKAAAQAIVSTAIRAGRLVPPATCSQCPNLRPHAHHEDYAKRLDVVWLCVTCHVRRHRELRTLAA